MSHPEIGSGPEKPTNNAHASDESDPIAIVGIGCRYADARGPEEFWRIIDSGRNTVREAPEHRIELGYDVDHFFDPRPRIPGKISSKKGGFLEHPELFDPAPFGIAPRDALTMEPQQRLLVEVTWDALEDAGIVPESIVGERVAVMLGYMAEDYSRERTGVLGEEAVFRGHDVFTVGGMSHAVLSGRIAYLLGVTGPSFTLDTACSSSLIATHLACQSLRRGESKLAIAGGANLFLSPEGNIALSRSGMLSMSGACKAFDASADGFVRAEGAGVVVLRPLADALEDGNPIYAVIRGSGISTDGRDGGHMMAPGRKGQAQAMRDAYAQAAVSPSDVQYVETHGTGTMIGDPVEIGALADVMGPGRDPERPLRVASVKGNLGHTESASGVAGLINAALAIRHRRLPRQLHFETPNPAIPWDDIPIRVQAESAPWPVDGPALVGVNSFGISGTNAHVVLESPPEPKAAKPDRSGAGESECSMLLPITGHDSKSLYAMAELHRASLEGRLNLELGDLVYTLGRRRSHRAHRLTVVAHSIDEMRLELSAYLDGNPFTNVRTGVATRDAASKLVMVFPGQGGQWLGMGRRLLEVEPVFGESIDRLDAAYALHVDWSLRAMLDGRSNVDWTQRLDVLQPVLVAVEIALAELWASWGIKPDRVIGQSMGEIAAAFVAGILSLEDMARLACHRGRIVERASGLGAMAVVSVSKKDVEAALAGVSTGVGRAEVAGSNSPTTTIVSGDRDAVTSLVAEFERRGSFARLLEVDFASHCFHMDPLLEPFRAGIEGIEPRPGTIPFDSTVDGREKPGEELGTDYWVSNLRAAVAFDRGLASSLEAGGHDLLEVSPHPVMSRAIDEIARNEARSYDYSCSLQRDHDDQRSLLTSLGELFTRGIDVDFESLVPDGQVVATPLYAYQRKRFWFSERNRLHRPRPVHPLLGARSQSSIDPRLYSWDFLLDSDSAGFVEDYRAIGMAGAPFGLYPELALAVADAMWPGQRTSVERFELTSALVFGPSGRRFVQAALRLEGEASGELRFSSRDDEGADWELHAICRLERADEASCSKLRTAFARGSRGAGEAQAADPFFANLERCGVSLGPKCRTLRELELEASDGDGQRSLLARMMLPRVSEAEWHAYKAHPAILESCFQLVGTLFEPAAAIRPIAIRRISFVRELGSDCWCRIRRWVGDAKAGAVRKVAEADLEFFDREGDWLGVIEGVQVEALPEIAGPNMGRVTDLHEMRWVASDQIATDSREEKSKKDVERWVVVSDSSLEAAVFAAELQKEGGSCLFCEKVEDLPLSANRMRADAGRPWGFLLLAWAGGAVQGEREPAAYRDFRVGSWAGAIRDHCEDASQVWIATRGLQRIGNDDRPPIELAPVIAREVETFASCVDMQRCRLFDASAELLQSERVSLAALLGRSAEERQYAGRGAEVYVPRLVEAEIALNVASEGSELAGVRNFRAVHTGKEGLDCLELQQVAEPELGEGEVAVEVSAAALSQLDVLTGLGLGRGPVTGPRVVGMDFAGVVIDVGASDHAYQIGDEVIGVHAGALARRLAVPVTSLAPKPAFFDFNEAAGLPLPNLIAQYALRVVARLRAGERVLLLSAGGGVGQAMVAIARRLGAEVNATASQAERRSALRELGARVLEEFPADSEMGDFDVIVSPDSGDLLHSTLARLAPGGRFLDLCPRNDFVRPEMGSIRLAANRSISAIDVGAMIRTEPTLVSALLEGTAKAARDGLLLPPSMSVFPLSEAGRALRYMAQNRHSGRVVLDMIDAPHQRIIERPTPQRGLEDSGRFVVSGTEPEAQSAIGEWLRDHGARDVVVTSSEGLGIAISESDPPRMGGWIHVTSESTRGADEIRRMMPALAETQIATRTLVSIRAARTGAPPVDRAWETRVWIDQLLLTETKPNARTLTLSIGEDLGARRIAETVGEALSGEMSEASLVRFSDRDRNERVGDARAPVFDLLEEREEKLAGSTFVVSEFLELTPPERRVAMQEFVCDSLANVLALSQEQRNEIDVGSRIDEMGLDSLMTLELFLGIGRDVELEIASDWFVSVPTLSEIASTLIERLDEIACEGS